MLHTDRVSKSVRHGITKGRENMAQIELTTGNILRADAEAIVNTVNCVGVMGRGIALQFKKAFPANFRAYALACDDGEVQPGRMFVFDTGAFTNPRYIINFPTKRHWKGKSRIEDIESGLVALAQEVRERGIKSVAIPPLGSGLGGLDWDEVRPRIEAALRDAPDLDVLIYQPNGAPEVVKSREVPKMTPGRRVARHPDAPLPARADGPVCHPDRSAEADVFHAGGRAAAAPKLHQASLWPLRHEPVARAEQGRRAFRVRFIGMAAISRTRN